MRILQLIHATQLRGAEIFACQLSEHLRSLDNEVFIVSLYDKSAPMPTSLKIIQLNSRRGFDLRAMRKLSKCITTNNIEVVQTNAGDTFKFASLSKILFGWKAKLIVRNATTMSELIKNKLHRFSYDILFKKVDKVISVSGHEAQDIKMLFPRCVSKTSMIPIGIERNSFPSPASQRQNNVLLHVGAFNKEKNHEGLIRIFHQILKLKPETYLWLAGDGPLRARTEEKVKQLGIQNNVKFLGNRTDIPQLMYAAAVFVLPSMTEGLPGVILEAMYSRLPVVANNAGGINEVVINDKTGWLIQRHDENTFAQTVVEVLNMSAENIGTITDNAYELVSTRFDNRTISKQFLDLYKEAAIA